jgi:hypothetical protein
MRIPMLCSMLGVLLGVSQGSYATTECGGLPTSYFTDTGSTVEKVWVVMPNGLQWYILQSDAASHSIVAELITSMATNAPIVVRFQADGVACDSSSGVRTDVVGMWLVRP